MFKILTCLIIAVHISNSLRKTMDGKLYKVYGVDFPKFLRAHPTALFVLHDNSLLSQTVLASLHKLEEQLSASGIILPIAKMSTKDAPSYSRLWSTHAFPHIRLYIGDGVYDEFRGYPSLEGLFEWVTIILKNDDTIRLIDSEPEADQFNEEPFAFYLRFPVSQPQYLNLLRKFQKLDNKLKVFYANKANVDPFESYNPKEMVIGFRRTFDDGNKFFASRNKINVLTIQNFFELFRHPEIHSLSQEHLEEMRAMPTKSMIFFDRAKRSEALNQFKRAASLFRKAFRFVVADLNEPHALELAKEAKIDLEGEMPQIRIIDAVDGKRRVFEVRAANEEEYTSAIDAFNNGELRNLLDEEVNGVSSEL